MRFVFLVVMFCSSSVLASGPADHYMCGEHDYCGYSGLYSQKSPGPTKSDAIRINPAAVPVETITGIETIYYRGSFDFALVKGFGRVGAAISPSNSEATFFGPPADEDPSDFYARMVARSKFDSQKYTAALGVNLLSNDGGSFSSVHVNAGVMARYIAFSRTLMPGLGLQASFGPLYVGGAFVRDQQEPLNVIEDDTLSTFSAGLSLDSVLLDYSVMNVAGDFAATASVATATVFINRFILTAARREVKSTSLGFDFSTNFPVAQNDKVEWFGGAQVRILPFLVGGVFYNYYLLHEVSFGATFFF